MSHLMWKLRPVAAALTAVAGEFKTTRAELTAPSRARPVSRYRQYAMWLAMELGASSNSTGRQMRRNHASVLHGRRQIRILRQADPTVAARCAKLVNTARNIVELTVATGAITVEARKTGVPTS